MTGRSIGIVCTSSGFGGLEINTLKLARWLGDQGWQVLLLVNEESPMFGVAGSYCPEVTSLQQLKDGASKASARILRKWLHKKPVDILLTPYNRDIKALSNFKRFWRRKVKLVYQQHMKVGVSKRDFLHRLRYNMLDLWISPLPYLKEEAGEKTTVAEKKIIVVRLGLEPGVFLQSPLTRSSARMQLNLPAQGDVIGVLGRIDPKKGQDFVVRAIAQLRDRYSRLYHLLIMGNITHGEGDRYLNHLHGLVRKHKLEDLVHFIPYHEDVNLFYKAIDVFAMPSHGETYGMVTLEAMISERPVIGADRDGTSALLQQGRLGWLYELEDIDDFCRKLFDLEQSGSKQDILLAAKQEVLDNYSMDRAMSETNQALQLLLQQ